MLSRALSTTKHDIPFGLVKFTCRLQHFVASRQDGSHAQNLKWEKALERWYHFLILKPWPKIKVGRCCCLPHQPVFTLAGILFECKSKLGSSALSRCGKTRRRLSKAWLIRKTVANRAENIQSQSPFKVRPLRRALRRGKVKILAGNAEVQQTKHGFDKVRDRVAERSVC